MRTWNRNAYIKDPDFRRESILRDKYGITLAHYDEMLERQENTCAICGLTPEENGKRLCVDHNHETGEVRGLLCDDCNRGIGTFRDNPVSLARAAEYLLGVKKNHESTL